MTFDTSLLGVFSITFVVSFIGLVGGFVLIWKRGFAQTWSQYLVSFAAGGILGATFFDLLPEAIDHGSDNMDRVFWYVLVGILIFFTLEKLLIWHHHAHGHADETDHPHQSLHSVKWMVIIGDALHNFLDGAIIAIAFLTDQRLGIVTAFAVVAHEIPQEFGDFTILLSSGIRRRSAILWNILGALVSPIGAIIGYSAHESFTQLEVPLLGIVVGNFIYLALADLIPSIQHERKPGPSIAQIALVLAGIGIIWVLGDLFPHG